MKIYTTNLVEMLILFFFFFQERLACIPECQQLAGAEGSLLFQTGWLVSSQSSFQILHAAA